MRLIAANLKLILSLKFSMKPARYDSYLKE